MPKKLAPVPFSAISLIADGKLKLYHDAPTVILIFKDTRGVSNPDLDCGIAGQNMVLAAHSMAKRLKETRHELELLIPVKLQIDLRASRREQFWGSVPAFVIPVMLMMVWGIILLTLIFVQWQ